MPRRRKSTTKKIPAKLKDLLQSDSAPTPDEVLALLNKVKASGVRRFSLRCPGTKYEITGEWSFKQATENAENTELRLENNRQAGEIAHMYQRIQQLEGYIAKATGTWPARIPGDPPVQWTTPDVTVQVESAA